MANLLTLFRLFLIPVFIYFMLMHPEKTLYSGVVLALAVLTDFFDGYVARNIGKVTQVGIFLDPLVDRLLVFSVLVIMYVKGMLPLLGVCLLIGRDVLIVGGYQFLRGRGITIAVTFLGKVATALIMVSFIGVLVKIPFAFVLFCIGVVLYLFSALDYLRLSYKELVKLS